MTATVNVNGHFSNQSLEGQEPRGNVGKLNPEQVKVRAKKHALRLATGRPTVQEIADFWMREYGISMSYFGEKDWASRNDDAIQAATIEMVESGEIKIQAFTETSLLNTLKVSGHETGKVIKKIEKSIIGILDSFDIDLDPMKKLGITDEQYAAADEKSQRALDKKIDAENARNKLRVKIVESYALILKDQKKILLETVQVANNLYQNSETRMKQIEKRVGHTVAEILTEKDKNELDSDVEITDADRERVLKRNGDSE